MFRRLRRSSKSSSMSSTDVAEEPLPTMWYKSHHLTSDRSAASEPPGSSPRVSHFEPGRKATGALSRSGSSYQNYEAQTSEMSSGMPLPESYSGATIDADLFALVLEGNQWALARKKLQHDPRSARQKDSVTMQGKMTVAYPMHIAVCLSPPISFVEALLNLYPDVTQRPDEICGRLPLHWACLSSASPSCLQILLSSYPQATQEKDKLQGRTPLHYISMYAKSVSQVLIVLNRDPGAVQVKDKQSKTPIDLVEEGSNPLKIDILAELRKRKTELAISKTYSHKKNDPNPKNSTDDADHGQWENPGNPLNMNVAKINGHEIRKNEKSSRPRHSPGLGTQTQQPGSSRTIGSSSAPQGVSGNNAGGRTDYRRHAESPGGGLPLSLSARTQFQSPEKQCNGFNSNSSGMHGEQRHLGSQPVYSQSLLQGESSDSKQLKQSTRGVPAPAPGGLILEKASLMFAKTGSRHSMTNDGAEMMAPPPTSIARRQKTWSERNNVEDSNQINAGQQKSRPQTSGSTGDLTGASGISNMKQKTESTNNASWGTGNGDYYHAYQSQAPPRQSHRHSHDMSLSKNLLSSTANSHRHTSPYSQQMNSSSPKPPHQNLDDQMAEHWMNDWKSNFDSLSQSLQKRKRELDQKNQQLARVDEQIRKMGMDQTNLTNQCKSAQAAYFEQQNAVQQRRGRISELSFQIEKLQSEIRLEKLQLEQIEPSLNILKKNVDSSEQQLKVNQEELGSLGAVKGALEEEKSVLSREVANSESELKSLEAIRSLARGDNIS